MNLIETVRSSTVRHELAKVSNWAQRRAVLMGALPKSSARVSPTDILKIGEFLSAGFQLPALRSNRSQSTLSGGGSTWTALVHAYLNCCLAGTDAVAVSGKFIPSSVKEALKVTHASSSSTKLNSDIDIVVVNAPGISNVGLPSRTNVEKLFSTEFASRFGESSVIVLQTKTNWNDNSQVPMLWNLIYKLAAANKIPANGVRVGSGTHHISAVKFGYAFVTVPTNKLSCFKPNSTAVVRVRSLTCGAYWGRPSQMGVMSCISEFFNTAFNVTNGCFPDPHRIGQGYCDEVQKHGGLIDDQAFGLY